MCRHSEHPLILHALFVHLWTCTASHNWTLVLEACGVLSTSLQFLTKSRGDVSGSLREPWAGVCTFVCDSAGVAFVTEQWSWDVQVLGKADRTVYRPSQPKGLATSNVALLCKEEFRSRGSIQGNRELCDSDDREDSET